MSEPSEDQTAPQARPATDSTTGSFAAVDLGATSGRVVLGRVGRDVLQVETVHRFENIPVRTPDGLHWNILELYRQILTGLAKAVERTPELVSVGIDSWAVDYALVEGESLVGIPFHYRDQRTSEGVQRVHAVVDHAALYARNGLQFQPFNTVYQLAVDQGAGRLTKGRKVLLLPDLLSSWLTGRQVAERTNASTTGLLDLDSGGWDTVLMERLGLPAALFPPTVDPGTIVGSLSPDVAKEIRARRRPDVVAVGSHDTASAVVGVPMGAGAAYISSGTWSLVGVELEKPVLTTASRKANFTNEGGVDGRIRYLKNVTGLWLLSESIRSWQRQGQRAELAELLEQATAVTAKISMFDVNEASLQSPGDMPVRIAALCRAAGEPAPETPAQVVRSILESLAAAYAAAVNEAEELSGLPIEAVHVVGGGSQNALLCQLTADRTGRRVLAGPVEATAIGNVLVQARTAGRVSGSLEELRALVARTFPPVEYRPSPVAG
ncbi:MAG TPA: rhamnulokinase family protein [Propionibacteriaceae bacterium]|nr:rhamnulokinase family protein [Propionibacteriaceae bacterium]